MYEATAQNMYIKHINTYPTYILRFVEIGQEMRSLDMKIKVLLTSIWAANRGIFLKNHAVACVANRNVVT